MSTLVIVGAQWGDEAKGKMADVFGQEADLVVRYSGGNNAGHTVIVGEKVFKLHLLPAGILHRHVTSVLAGGMVICPKSLVEEIAQVKSQTEDFGKLVISTTAHVVFPYHKALDQLEESARGSNRIGTTSRGIGPAYTDKVQRIGIRMGEFVNPERFRERLHEVLDFKNRLMKLLGGEPIKFESLYDEYATLAEQLAPFVDDGERVVQDAVLNCQRVLFEGAQGALLDLDYGTYPYVTSSHPTSGGACLATGVGPRDIHNVLGVCKAYATRVGEGPFPTELTNKIGEQIREQGHEYGTTTGRPRRCGWLDLVALRHAARINSLSGLIITRLDVLSGIGDIEVATSYKQPSLKGDQIPTTLEDWATVEPEYRTLDGWDEDITQAKKWDDLPETVQNYVRAVEEFVGVPAAVLSIGPERTQTIVLRRDLVWSDV